MRFFRRAYVTSAIFATVALKIHHVPAFLRRRPFAETFSGVYTVRMSLFSDAIRSPPWDLYKSLCRTERYLFIPLTCVMQLKPIVE